MKKLIFSAFAFMLVFAACKKDDNPAPSAVADIISFSINNVNGTITGTDILVVLSDTVQIDSLVPVIVVSEKATVNPLTNVVKDFTAPVKYTVTAEDGTTKKTYTVSVLALSDGIGSVKKIWSKNSNDPNWQMHNHAEPSLALWGENLVMVQLNSYGSTEYKLRVFNKNTGDALVGTSIKLTDASGNAVAGGPALTTDADHTTLISCNLAAVGADFSIWKWTSLSTTPAKMLTCNNEWDNRFAAAPGDWASAWVGRQLTVKGNLETDAYIYATPSFSNTVLRWKVTNGAVTSQTPEKLLISGMNNSNWEVNAGVAAFDNTAGSKLLVSGTLCGTMLVNSSRSVEWSLDRAFGENACEFLKFNGKDYFSTLQLDAYAGATDDNVPGAWADIFNLAETAADPANAWPASFKETTVNYSKVMQADGPKVYFDNCKESADLICHEQTVTGLIHTLRVYVLGTNCGVACYELSNLAAGSAK